MSRFKTMLTSRLFLTLPSPAQFVGALPIARAMSFSIVNVFCVSLFRHHTSIKGATLYNSKQHAIAGCYTRSYAIEHANTGGCSVACVPRCDTNLLLNQGNHPGKGPVFGYASSGATWPLAE
ncbi:hypothetical protein LX36DRAFT_653983 [Colletotrichum falcatum]|nr:hypothetical protein LX36DRAFT_653983 [Colletotrichum falcatum]